MALEIPAKFLTSSAVGPDLTREAKLHFVNTLANSRAFVWQSNARLRKYEDEFTLASEGVYQAAGKKVGNKFSESASIASEKDSSTRSKKGGT
jgi:hypothetical protein